MTTRQYKYKEGSRWVRVTEDAVVAEMQRRAREVGCELSPTSAVLDFIREYDARLVGEDDMPAGMLDVQARIAEWQASQFPHATLDGAAAHLERELHEAAEELADCFFLSSQCERLGGMPVALPEACWHAIASLGLSPASVILSKLDKNKRRTWPTTPDEEGVYEAIDAKDEDEK